MNKNTPAVWRMVELHRRLSKTYKAGRAELLMDCVSRSEIRLLLYADLFW